MKFIKEFRMFEGYERPKTPVIDTKWIKKDTEEVATILGAGDKYISYTINGERIDSTIYEFLKDFTEIVKPVIVPKKNMYADRLSAEDDLELDFNKSEYLEDEKAIIAAYFITKDSDNSIEVMNVKEFASETATYMDGSTPYTVTFHKVTLPKSKIEILDEVEGKPGFFYIKMPYWLYQANKDDLFIKRVKDTKGLDIRDAQLGDKTFMLSFKDPDVLKYISSSDPGSVRKVNIYSK